MQKETSYEKGIKLLAFIIVALGFVVSQDLFWDIVRRFSTGWEFALFSFAFRGIGAIMVFFSSVFLTDDHDKLYSFMDKHGYFRAVLATIIDAGAFIVHRIAGLIMVIVYALCNEDSDVAADETKSVMKGLDDNYMMLDSSIRFLYVCMFIHAIISMVVVTLGSEKTVNTIIHSICMFWGALTAISMYNNIVERMIKQRKR